MVTIEQIIPSDPEDFPTRFLEALDNPECIWKEVFRTLLSPYQNLLIALFFSNNRGESIDTLRVNFNSLNKKLCLELGKSFGFYDFKDALRSLESGFISIAGQIVQFVNPGVRDFLNSFLNNPELILFLPTVAQRADWARNLFQYGMSILSQSQFQEFSKLFIEFAKRADHYPTFTTSQNGFTQKITKDDLPLGQRIEFLVSLALESADSSFLREASLIIHRGKLEIIAVEDGYTLPIIHKKLRDSVSLDPLLCQNLVQQIENLIINVAENFGSTGALISLLDAINESMKDGGLPPLISKAIEDAVTIEVECVEETISGFNTSHEHGDYLEMLETIEDLSGVDLTYEKDSVVQEKENVEEREFEEYQFNDEYFSVQSNQKCDELSDKELRSIFHTLVD